MRVARQPGGAGGGDECWIRAGSTPAGLGSRGSTGSRADRYSLDTGRGGLRTRGSCPRLYAPAGALAQAGGGLRWLGATAEPGGVMSNPKITQASKRWSIDALFEAKGCASSSAGSAPQRRGRACPAARISSSEGIPRSPPGPRWRARCWPSGRCRRDRYRAPAERAPQPDEQREKERAPSPIVGQRHGVVSVDGREGEVGRRLVRRDWLS